MKLEMGGPKWMRKSESSIVADESVLIICWHNDSPNHFTISLLREHMVLSAPLSFSSFAPAFVPAVRLCRIPNLSPIDLITSLDSLV